MQANDRLNVVVGMPFASSDLPEGPCIVLDGAEKKSDHLFNFDGCKRQSNIVLYEQCVLVEYPGEKVTWNTYSDSRFDGPLELADLEQFGFNLELIQSISVQGKTLDYVLDQCELLQAPHSTFSLLLRQGDPYSALKGVQKWLSRCTQITFRYHQLLPKQLSECEAFLKDNKFNPSQDDPSVWIPHCLEIPVSYWSEFNFKVNLLFDADSYRKLYPELDDLTDQELFQNWLASAGPQQQAEAMREVLQKTSCPLAALSDSDPLFGFIDIFFPYEFYRSKRPDLVNLTNRQLLMHFWEYGRFEGVDLSESCIAQTLSLQAVNTTKKNEKDLKARIAELENSLELLKTQQINSLSRLNPSSRI